MKFLKAGRQTDENLPAVVKQPDPSDYLPERIQKEVLRTGFSHPCSLYPFAIGLGCGAAGLILSMPLLYLIAAGGLLVGPVWAVVQIFFLPDRIRKKYLAKLEAERVNYREFLKSELRRGLQYKYASEKANELARKGIKQFDRAAEALKDIVDLLAMKLKTDELLFHRFLAATEQTYLSILDSLKDCVALLKSADSINPEELKECLSKISRMKKITPAAEEEKQAVSERLELWQNQMDDVEKRQARNERALTELEQISRKIAEWQTDRHFALTDIEATIAELQHLAKFAHTINNSQ
ncbi:MAG: hypothetical protein Q8N81_02995 [bacterium]|nr:hypothetical protein [bacterium]